MAPTDSDTPPPPPPSAAAAAAPTAPSAAAAAAAAVPKPTVCILVGMAGAGKSTLLQRLNHAAHDGGMASYYVNLDPACAHMPFAANLDIRDTVDYKAVMKTYGLGPNGAIMTSLNLFATRFDQVMTILEQRAADAANPLQYVFVDTPGQIEVFTWSASGQIITEALASSFPTVVVYVVDTPRTTRASTFMANMLYACSIMYKTRLPLVVAFNKTDIAPHTFAVEWMEDFEAFQNALDTINDESYVGSLNRSLSLVLDEFYRSLAHCGVSAATGDGVDDFFAKVADATAEYAEEYLPDLERRRQGALAAKGAGDDVSALMQKLEVEHEAAAEAAVAVAAGADGAGEAAASVGGGGGEGESK